MTPSPAGDFAAAARLLRAIEDGDPSADAALAALAAQPTGGPIIGITGSAGVGKSTLLGALITLWRTAGQSVGVLAIDPSSARTGGALLGDRLRMNEHAADPGVFIRSVAARGASGGIAQATAAMVVVLQGMGLQRVVIETLGTGQSDVDVCRLATVTVLVTTPFAGDEVQAMKAGLVEEADILVVNKADLPGSERALEQLQVASGRPSASGRTVLATSAALRTGVAELASAIDAHAALRGPRGAAERGASLIAAAAVDRVRDDVTSWLRANESGRELAAAVGRGAQPAREAARTALAAVLPAPNAT